MPTTVPDRDYKGAQFFISTDATGEYSRNYRWDLEETWEYHAAYATWGYYDGSISKGESSSDSIRICYRTMRINDFYTFSTRHLTNDHISRLPINLVTNQSKLSVRYSLLVNQYSLSATAYDYWKDLEGQSKQTGDLYATQPARIFGNIRSLENPEETVLGYFSASSITEKRIIIKPKIQFSSSLSCPPAGLEEPELKMFLERIPQEDYPVFLYDVGGDPPIFDYADPHCFDCQLSLGTLEKPDFW
jgi:hypothetical protein